jgi:hypothetical protein
LPVWGEPVSKPEEVARRSTYFAFWLAFDIYISDLLTANTHIKTIITIMIDTHTTKMGGYTTQPAKMFVYLPNVGSRLGELLEHGTC